MKKTVIIIIFAIILVASGGYILQPKIKNYFTNQKINQDNKETMELIDEIIRNKPPANRIETELPASSYLEVQFICQAPLETEANWVYHEESCEEAAVLMAYNFRENQTVTKEEANEIILDMIKWQEENLGSHHDLYADELKNFIIGYYGIPESDITIIYDASIEELKKQINMGHPVIVPITGEILKNPYYPYPGYHMLLAIGYTEDRIITNDNGTRRGKDFSYEISVFEAAMKDAGGDIVIINKNSPNL